MKPLNRFTYFQAFLILGLILSAVPSSAWFDEIHPAIAKAAGYQKWYNATGADIAKIKADAIEKDNHYANNAAGTVVTPDMIRSQIARYNKPDETGHLYGAIMASFRDYVETQRAGKYADYHLAYTVHYISDLSQPLHNTLHNAFNKKNHLAFDGVINDNALKEFDKIRLYPISIESEDDLVKEIARIANQAMRLGYRIESEGRLLTPEERRHGDR